MDKIDFLGVCGCGSIVEICYMKFLVLYNDGCQSQLLCLEPQCNEEFYSEEKYDETIKPQLTFLYCSSSTVYFNTMANFIHKIAINHELLNEIYTADTLDGEKVYFAHYTGLLTLEQYQAYRKIIPPPKVPMLLHTRESSSTHNIGIVDTDGIPKWVKPTTKIGIYPVIHFLNKERVKILYINSSF